MEVIILLLWNTSKREKISYKCIIKKETILNFHIELYVFL